MISAYSTLVSAFAGTVLPQYKPYCQFGPSVVGVTLVLGFGLYYALHPGVSKPVLITTNPPPDLAFQPVSCQRYHAR